MFKYEVESDVVIKGDHNTRQPAVIMGRERYCDGTNNYRVSYKNSEGQRIYTWILESDLDLP